MSPEPVKTEPRPAEPAPRFGLIQLMAVLTALIGVAMIVRALTAGGGVSSYGVVIGAFFLAAGVLRLRLLMSRSRR